MTPEICPNCGDEVPPKAKACPGCGACEDTGWSDDAYADRLGIPSENFDYNDYVKRELSPEKPKQKYGKLWAAVAIVLLAIFAYGWLR